MSEVNKCMYVVLITLDILKDVFFNEAKVLEDNTTREGILDSTLRTTFKACRWNQNPSMAVSVVKDGKQVFSKAYGHKDMESRDPTTTTTMFGIGSLTKIFANLLVQKFMSNYSR